MLSWQLCFWSEHYTSGWASLSLPACSCTWPALLRILFQVRLSGYLGRWWALEVTGSWSWETYCCCIMLLFPFWIISYDPQSIALAFRFLVSPVATGCWFLPFLVLLLLWSVSCRFQTRFWSSLFAPSGLLFTSLDVHFDFVNWGSYLEPHFWSTLD